VTGVQTCALPILHSGESGKSFQVGKAAQSGVLAGLLAQQGADGPESVFEGEKGFFKAFAGKPCDSQSICKNLGKDFNLPSVYFKKHAACRHIHSALDAIAEIVAWYTLSPEKIRSIDIETYSIAKSLTGHIATEDSELGAKFSTPIAIGLLLVFGQSDSSIYKKQYVSDPLVQSSAKKVTLRVNPERDKAYPGQRGSSVTVETGDQSYTHEVIYPKGEPENPLSDDEMTSKFNKNASTLYAMDRVNKIRGILLNIENRDVRELTSMLNAPSLP
jgi:2-methylcitrate dehydratase PrpD